MTRSAVAKASIAPKLGRYEIISEIGQGSMGVVCKAHDPMLDRVVAIKTINLTLPREELVEYEARFNQEAKAAGGLSHRNIVTIYDVGRSDRVAYMAMEFLEGQELRRLMQAHVPIKVEHGLEIVAQVAEGLQYAHDRQVIHRDIKPANIMVLNDGLVKITDFGIARMRTNEVKTMTGMILGSPKYMSPEQVSGKRADTRSDIFSLGVVLYEILTGTSPFVADNIHGVMYQTMNFTPPAPRTLNPDLPEALNFIVAKALAKNLDDRYQKAQEFAGDLRQTLAVLCGESSTTWGASDYLDHSSVAESAPLLAPQKFDAQSTSGPDDDNLASAPRPAQASASPAGALTDQPVLGLSKSFDSFDATMRLAAMTGTEKELDKFSDTQKIARLKMLAEANRADAAALSAVSSSTTWKNPTTIERKNIHAISAAPNLKWVWITSAILALAAAILFLLR